MERPWVTLDVIRGDATFFTWNVLTADDVTAVIMIIVLYDTGSLVVYCVRDDPEVESWGVA